MPNRVTAIVALCRSISINQGGGAVNILKATKTGGLILAMSLFLTHTAWAQTQTSSSEMDASKFSVQAGMGFFAEDNFDGFLLNFEGSYHIDQNWSVGVGIQLGFDDDFLLLSMPFFGQYDFGNIPGEIPILSDMHPFARLGIGFTYAEFDPGPFDFDDTGFLFVIGGGLAYPINDELSLESKMQFNITSNDFFEDDYYFSWEMVSLRYRF